jgi:hypothetical protein
MKKIMMLLCLFLVLLSVFSLSVCAQEDVEPFVEPILFEETIDEPYIEPVAGGDIPLPPEPYIEMPMEEIFPAADLGAEPGAEEMPMFPEEIEIEEEFPEGLAAGAGLAAAGVAMVLIVTLVFFAVIIVFFIFWLLMIIDCAKRSFKNDTDKVIWILVIVLVGFIGAIIYYFVVRRPAKKKGR